VPYLGIELDEALELAEQTEVLSQISREQRPRSSWSLLKLSERLDWDALWQRPQLADFRQSINQPTCNAISHCVFHELRLEQVGAKTMRRISNANAGAAFRQ
jgi:hypothetical protein